MIDVSVKTLDGQNRSFSVPDDNITAENQRLIFQGRVLQDDKKLAEFDVDGKTLHVVMRPPPSTRSTTTTASSSPGQTRRNRGTNVSNVLLGSITLPTDTVDPNQFQDMVQQVISGLGEAGRNAHVTARTSSDGSSMDVNINLGTVGLVTVVSEAQCRLSQARLMIRQAHRILDTLENPPSTESRQDSPMDTEQPSPPSDATTSDTPRNDTSQRSEASTSQVPETGAGQGSEAASSQASESGASQRSDASPSTSEAQGSTAQNGGQGRGQVRHPPASALAEVIQQLMALQRRLQPHLDRYETLLRDDPPVPDEESDRRSTRRLCNLVSEVLHLVGHAYHHMSDIMIDTTRAPPRHLHAPLSFAGPGSAIIQHSAPVQINVAHTVGGPRPTAPTTTTTPTSAAPTSTPTSAPTAPASSTATSATSSSSVPPQTTSGPMPAHGPIPGFPPPGFLGGAGFPGNPYMFMGVGPNGAMSFNTVSADVVTSTSTTRQSTPTTTSQSGTGAPGGPPNAPPNAPPFLPPGFLQNIMQNAMMNAPMGAPHMVVVTRLESTATPSGPTNTPPNTTPQSNPQQSTPTTSATRPTGPPPPYSSVPPRSAPGNGPPPRSAPGNGPPPRRAAFVVPHDIPHGPHMGMPFAPVDPYLPCNSRHFLSRVAANAANSSNNQGGAVSEPSSVSPEQSLAGLVGQIVQTLTAQAPGAAQTTTTPSSQSAPMTSTRPSPPTTSSPSASSNTSSNAIPPDAASLFNMLQGSRSQFSATNPPPSDAMYNNMVQAISHSMSPAARGQPNTNTIAQVLEQFGLMSEGNGETAEGILSDIIMLMSNHLSFPDLVMLFFGMPAPLARMRASFQEFIRTRILRGAEETVANITSSVDRVVTEMQPDIQAVTANASVVDDIDFTATLSEFIRQHLTATIRLILNATADDGGFGQSLLNRVTVVCHEFIVLCGSCLEGGQAEVDQLIQARIRHLASGDTSDEMVAWMTSMSSQRLNQMIPNITITPNQVASYIVRRDPTLTSSPSSDTFMSAHSGSSESDNMETNGAKQDEAMDTDTDDHATSGGVRRPIAPRQAPELDAALLDHLPPPPRRDELDGEYDVGATGGADWQRAVPTEWVPVIARDIRRQRQQPPQAPYSDAYINGMPSKRRKLMGNRSVETQLSDTSNILPRTLVRSVEEAGVVPSTSIDRLETDAAQDPALREAFQAQIHRTLAARINNDEDFIADKYPNSHKYYSKQ